MLPWVDLCAGRSIDAAWAEAEAALPDGWELRFRVTAHGPYAAIVRGDGDTPAAALRALAERLHAD